MSKHEQSQGPEGQEDSLIVIGGEQGQAGPADAVDPSLVAIKEITKLLTEDDYHEEEVDGYREQKTYVEYLTKFSIHCEAREEKAFHDNSLEKYAPKDPQDLINEINSQIEIINNKGGLSLTSLTKYKNNNLVNKGSLEELRKSLKKISLHDEFDQECSALIELLRKITNFNEKINVYNKIINVRDSQARGKKKNAERMGLVGTVAGAVNRVSAAAPPDHGAGPAAGSASGPREGKGRASAADPATNSTASASDSRGDKNPQTVMHKKFTEVIKRNQDKESVELLVKEVTFLSDCCGKIEKKIKQLSQENANLKEQLSKTSGQEGVASFPQGGVAAYPENLVADSVDWSNLQELKKVIDKDKEGSAEFSMKEIKYLWYTYIGLAKRGGELLKQNYMIKRGVKKNRQGGVASSAQGGAAAPPDHDVAGPAAASASGSRKGKGRASAADGSGILPPRPGFRASIVGQPTMPAAASDANRWSGAIGGHFAGRASSAVTRVTYNEVPDPFPDTIKGRWKDVSTEKSYSDYSGQVDLSTEKLANLGNRLKMGFEFTSKTHTAFNVGLFDDVPVNDAKRLAGLVKWIAIEKKFLIQCIEKLEEQNPELAAKLQESKEPAAEDYLSHRRPTPKSLQELEGHNKRDFEAANNLLAKLGGDQAALTKKVNNFADFVDQISSEGSDLSVRVSRLAEMVLDERSKPSKDGHAQTAMDVDGASAAGPAHSEEKGLRTGGVEKETLRRV